MGNPSMRSEDAGPCWECQHWKGWRTEPDRRPLTLCGQGMLTFRFVSLPPERGCRYFEPQEPVIPQESG